MKWLIYLYLQHNPIYVTIEDLRSYIIGVFKLLQTVDHDFMNRFFGQSLDVLIENCDAIFKQIKDALSAGKPGTNDWFEWHFSQVASSVRVASSVKQAGINKHCNQSSGWR